MPLPRPQDQLAGCVWLPRFAEKARRFLGQQLPLTSRVAFGSRPGIDGAFLRHFGLTAPQFLVAVRRSGDNEALSKWFLSLPEARPERIAEWNRRATLLGAKGHPGYLIRHVVKWFFYPKSVLSPVNSLFEAIEQDER
ncbi:MAG: DUF5069 domain-containing protein [Nitrospira sp.]|nr:DUF5069 domain-containing protein [Nitrospira sp.]